MIKNLPDVPICLAEVIKIYKNQIVSTSFLENEHVAINLLAFADLENVSKEKYLGDVLYYMVSGSCDIKTEDQTQHLNEGEILKIDKDVLHELCATEAFKILQIIIN